MKKRLSYLFWTFLKIGAVSFGGHMGLVAVVQKNLAGRDGLISPDEILEGVALAGILPGPLAVNVVAFIGYRIRGLPGALIAMLGVLLPAVAVMLFLSSQYVSGAHWIRLPGLLDGVAAAVAGIVLSAGWQLFLKQVKGWWKYALCFAAMAAILGLKGYLVTLAVIVGGGIVGAWAGGRSASSGSSASSAFGGAPRLRDVRGRWWSRACLLLLGGCLLQFLADAQRFLPGIGLRLVSVFSGMSLSLFGGGYAMVPMMQSILVDSLHWLSRPEFVDAIAFGQATPGPILVSATFVGYKLGGLAGALLATAAIFLPSALLMISLTTMLGRYRAGGRAQGMLAGIKVVVIGMILASAVKIIGQNELTLFVAILAVLSFLLSFRFKVNPVWIIAGSVVAGLLKLLIQARI